LVSVAEHYEYHLAPLYLWMSGGLDAAMARGLEEIDAVCPQACGGAVAVDLGAGFGMHALALARRGYSVVAIDSSEALLKVLQDHRGELPIRVVRDDLLDFSKHLNGKAQRILCMGDTLTHLPDLQLVRQLFSQVAKSLHAGGVFIASFRDYTASLVGPARFIPVRSDNDRILTCFLEYFNDHVVVHDMLYALHDCAWQLQVSAYQKLRLAPQWVVAALQAEGFAVRSEPGLAGMVRIVATKPLA